MVSSHSVLAAAALKPGAVLGEPDDGLVNFVANLRDVERGEVAGYNSKTTGGYRQLFPRLSREDYATLQSTELPEVPGYLDDLLSRFNHLTAGERRMFLTSRKAVRQPLGDGLSRVILVPRAPSAMTELELLDAEKVTGVTHLTGEEEYDPPLAQREKKKTYTLANVLNDEQILAKYDLPVRAMETAKRMAAVESVTAAKMFQHLMNGCQRRVAVSVSIEGFSRNKAQASAVIRQVCSGSNRTDTAVHSLVSMNKFFMFGPGGEDDWFVSGPLREATSVSYVYWLVRQEGCVLPSVLLSMELVLLGIDIYDGHSCQEPELEYHASNPDVEMPSPGISSRTSSVLSGQQFQVLSGMAGRLLPVMNEAGMQVATAVRVTGKYVLVNTHVLEANDGSTVGGKRVTVHSQLARDLWSVKCDGEADTWTLRDPLKGEQVVVVYLAEGQLTVSAPLTITSIDESCIVTNKDVSVSYGTSGGALVALSDMSILGVHSASTQRNLLSFRFGPKQFSELLETDSVSAFSRHSDPESFAGSVSSHFQRRGLSGVLSAAIGSLEPVFSGDKHVGMAICNGEHRYTPCSPEMPLRLGPDRAPAKFETVYPGILYKTASQGPSTVPAMRRNPEFFEKAFVLGHDEDDVYISRETQVAHIGPDAKSFVLADMSGTDKPLLGGLVMGWDGAFLGCCGRRSASTPVGLGYICWTIPADAPKVTTDPRVILRRVFPFLNVAAWPDFLLEEVFVHSSVGHYADNRPFNAGCKPLANMGDNIAKFELYKSLREHRYPHSQWAGVMQALQSNAKFASIAWDYEFAQLLVLGGGAALPKESKAYADLTEALIGAAATQETESVVAQLCKAMGVVYSRPVAGSRSRSDFAVD